MEGTVTGRTYTTNDFPTKEINDGFKERVEKYLRLSHQTLAEMLALRDEKVEDCPIQPNQPYTPYYPNQPYTPYYPYYPYTPINTKWCPISMAECTNPFGDCINCPYHGVTYNTTCTNSTADLGTNVNSTNKDHCDFMERLKKSEI